MFAIIFLLCSAIVNQSLAEFDPTLHPNWHLVRSPSCELGYEAIFNSRIIGGIPTAPHEFPWMAYLLAKSVRPGAREFINCGGSILNERTVLTAAHCVSGLKETDIFNNTWGVDVIKVAVGDHTIVYREVDCDGRQCDNTVQVKNVQGIIMHDEFNIVAWIADIALIRLASDIQFNSYVVPICLPRGYLMNHPYTGLVTIAAGWGRKDPNKKILSSILRKVFLVVRKNIACQRLPNDQSIANICVGGLRDREGVCKGDSGGPLMLVDKNLTNGEPRVYVIGIVSHSEPYTCGAKGSPQVYTRVSAFMEWILDNLVEDKNHVKVIF